jgi:bacterioferritin-associated ferredoxin
MVCLCRGVSERKVLRAIDAGATTIDAVAEHCGAGSTWYGCHPTIDDLLVTRVSVRARRAAFA